MQNFEVTILGSSSATPTSRRYPTAQLLNIAERFFLIDCGEATQIQLRKFKLKFQRINHIFISHLHGDHYLGLMGLLSSMHLLGRTTDLHLFCPAELREIIDVQLKHSQSYLQYKIVYHDHRYVDGDVVYEDEKVQVSTIVLNHRIPCCGFIFREKELLPNISREVITEHNLSVEQIIAIKKGSDLVTISGDKIPNAHLVTRQKPRAYAFCSDTVYDERLATLLKDVDLLYHEATFLHDMLERARATYHTTALQAGQLARLAGVKKLMIGHFSARYKDVEPLLVEARKEFENTVLANEGECYRVLHLPV